MLEANTHYHLKNLLKKDKFIWPHNLTLSRLVARSLRRKDNTLIQLDLGSQNCWWIGVLLPLCLEQFDTILLISNRQRRRILRYEIPKLKSEELGLACWEGEDAPIKKQLWLVNYYEFINLYKHKKLQGKQVIIPEADLLNKRLRGAMQIKISTKEWEILRRAHPSAEGLILEINGLIKKNILSRKNISNRPIQILRENALALKNLLALLQPSPSPWPELITAINQNWASWGELDNKTLDWIWHLSPIDPLINFKTYLKDSPVLMIAESSNKKSFKEELDAIKFPIDVNVSLGEQLNKNALKLFIPERPPLPNSKTFSNHILEQSRRLIVGQAGITILIIDDLNLRFKLTSELAAEFGKRVIHESTSPDENGVICCSCSWWIDNQDLLPTPIQLIFGILPFYSLESPEIATKVNELKRKGDDWFRKFLLPEMLHLLPYAVAPLRENNGRIAILDGRIQFRSWGVQIFQSLEPWTQIKRLLPD